MTAWLPRMTTTLHPTPRARALSEFSQASAKTTHPTSPRSYNFIASSTMIKKGIPQIDNVSPTLPFIVLGSDVAHFTHPPLLAVQPAIVLQQLCAILTTRLQMEAPAARASPMCPSSAAEPDLRFALM